MISRFFIRIALFLLLGAAAAVQAQVYRWQNLTSKDAITSLENYAGYIWVTTTGGVVRINTSTNEVKAYINSDGLGSIRVGFSTYAGDSVTYFGSSDGVLSRFDMSGGYFANTEFQGSDGARLKLIDADTTEGFLWIACNIGIIKFDRFRHGGEVKEIYRTLGTFATEAPVYAVAVFAGKVYAGGAEGIALADRSSSFLLDPREWRNIGKSIAGFNADTVLCFEQMGGHLYAGANRGLFVIDSDSAVSPIGFFKDLRIYDLAIGDSGLLVVAGNSTGRRLYSFDGGDASQITLRNVPDTSLNTVTNAGKLYVGTKADGAYRASDTGFVKYQLPGPVGNDVTGGGFTADGILYIVSRNGNFAKLRNGIWEAVPVPNVAKLHALVAKDGSLWIGTFVQGAFQYTPNRALGVYNATNSPLSGPNLYPSASSFVNRLAEDPAGNIWFSAYQNSPMRPMIMFSPADSHWTYFDATDGIIDSNSYAIAGGVGMAAIGFRDQGVALLRYGASPLDHRDDVLTFYDRNKNLPSNTVLALAFDRDNRLWVGTNAGLAYFDEGNDYFYPVGLPDGVSSEVRCITADTRNNLWIGTAKGLAFISDRLTQMTTITSENSELVSNDIQSLSFDSNSGRLLVFTSGGLSILDYNLSPSDSTSSVYAYPNPFVIQLGVNATLQFKINQRATVRILAVSGELVRVTDVNIGWDGKNENGLLVASGVYVYELIAEDHSRHSGKILVLRR